MIYKRGFFFTLICIGLIALTACDQGSANGQPDSLRILFIGNSLTYTNDLPGMLQKLLEQTDIDTVAESVALPNYGLQDHWANPETVQKIADGSWDYVVLQQGPSATEGRPSLLEYSEMFNDFITQAGGQTALYMVWPWLSRSFDFDLVSDAYRTAAEQVDGLLFPAGEAWRAAWRKDPNLGLYGPDNFHPSELGTYVAALVMYEQLAKKARASCRRPFQPHQVNGLFLRMWPRSCKSPLWKPTKNLPASRRCGTFRLWSGSWFAACGVRSSGHCGPPRFV